MRKARHMNASVWTITGRQTSRHPNVQNVGKNRSGPILTSFVLPPGAQIRLIDPFGGTLHLREPPVQSTWPTFYEHYVSAPSVPLGAVVRAEDTRWARTALHLLRFAEYAVRRVISVDAARARDWGTSETHRAWCWLYPAHLWGVATGAFALDELAQRLPRWAPKVRALLDDLDDPNSHPSIDGFTTVLVALAWARMADDRREQKQRWRAVEAVLRLGGDVWELVEPGGEPALP